MEGQFKGIIDAEQITGALNKIEKNTRTGENRLMFSQVGIDFNVQFSVGQVGANLSFYKDLRAQFNFDYNKLVRVVRVEAFMFQEPDESMNVQDWGLELYPVKLGDDFWPSDPVNTFSLPPPGWGSFVGEVNRGFSLSKSNPSLDLYADHMYTKGINVETCTITRAGTTATTVAKDFRFRLRWTIDPEDTL